jgi:hypothetical protein
VSWIVVLSSLHDDGGVASALVHRRVRGQARRFNAVYEEMYRMQNLAFEGQLRPITYEDSLTHLT